MHTYHLTCIHTPLHTYIPFLQLYIRAYTHTCLYIYVHTQPHTYISFLHPYIIIQYLHGT
uniref:Uncharacterized protein n=1 Tax=Helianthus annuus TaxID=4232 RepID=A0A251VF95_HELAN